jgi:tripartite-type tricarboxylate transporter receptor subunit TctC
LPDKPAAALKTRPHYGRQRRCAVNPFLQNLSFDTEKDLEPVLLIGTAPNLLATHPERPFKTFADVIAAAKAKPDSVAYGSVGSGSLGHLTMVLLSQRAGVKMVHVPYRGGGPLMNDALAGHVDLAIGSAALVTPQVTGGKLRGLVQTGANRNTGLPNVPTVIESGMRWQIHCANLQSRAGSKRCRSLWSSAARTRNARSK